MYGVSFPCFRLASSQDDAMRNFFIEAESKLFQYRLSCMTESEVATALKPLQRLQRLLRNTHDKVSTPMAEILCILNYLTEGYSWESLTSKYAAGSRDAFLIIPFQYVLGLLSKRAVTLENGYAHVPCGKLSEILIFLFEQLLTCGMNEAKKQLQLAMDDGRIQNLFQKLKVEYEASRFI